VAAVRFETEDLRQRLDAAYAELERKGADDDRLAAELAASRMTTDSATVMAQEKPAAIEDQIRVPAWRRQHDPISSLTRVVTGPASGGAGFAS
jgi:hypothetical protein